MSNVLLRALVIATALCGLAAPALARVEIFVDLSRQRMTVKKPGGETLEWKVSSGRSGFETPTGVFNVQRMDAEHFSDEYDQAPMPYAIFFSRGLAIHGSYERGLGHPVSHGCVRLSVQNAPGWSSMARRSRSPEARTKWLRKTTSPTAANAAPENKGCLLFGRHEFVVSGGDLVSPRGILFLLGGT
jgi:hypothetical protein